MKIKSILAIVIAVFLTGSVFAQPGPGRGMHRGPDFKPERMLEHLKTQLNLTDEQYNSIKDVLFAAEKEMVDLRKEAFEQQKQIRDQRRAFMDQTHEKIAEFLNDEQKAELEKMREEMREQRDDRPMQGRKSRPGMGKRNRW